MIDVTIFSTMNDLKELTGLDHDGLRKAGFDLEDWDFGVASKEILHDGDDDDMSPDFDRSYGTAWIMQAMLDHCCGPTHTEYNEMHYYLVHHA